MASSLDSKEVYPEEEIVQLSASQSVSEHTGSEYRPSPEDISESSAKSQVTHSNYQKFLIIIK